METTELDQGKRIRSIGQLTSAMFLFGCVGILRKKIPLASPFIAMCRGITGSLFLLALSAMQGKNPWKDLDRRTMWKLLATGAIIGLNWDCLFEAYRYTTVSTAAMFYYMQPVIVVLASSVLFHEKMTVQKVLCTLGAIIGMILISGVIETAMPRGEDLKGILFALCAACLYAAVVLMNKSIRGVDPYGKTILQLAAAGIVQIPYLLLKDDVVVGEWNIGSLGLLLLLCIVFTGVSYTLYFGSMDSLKSSTIALFSYIDPVTALILSALIMHEKLTVFGWIGAALILVSAALCERKRE